jgi:hypothetical protein
MNKYVKYILTIGWILFSRSYDAYCSVLLTPDLKKEANPLVTVGGISSWTPLLIGTPFIKVPLGLWIFCHMKKDIHLVNLFHLFTWDKKIIGRQYCTSFPKIYID